MILLPYTQSSLTVPRGKQHLHQNTVCWFQLSIQHYPTLEDDWQTEHSGPKYHTLQPETGVTQGCVFSPLLFTLTAAPNMEKPQFWNLEMTPPSSTVLLNGSEKTNHCLHQENQGTVDFTKKKKQMHMPLSTSVELTWSRWTVFGSWESTSQRTCHGHRTSPPRCRKLRNSRVNILKS